MYLGKRHQWPLGGPELGKQYEGVTRGVRNWRWPLSAAICSQLMIQAMVSGHPRCVSRAAFKSWHLQPKRSTSTTDDLKEKINFKFNFRLKKERVLLVLVLS